MMTVLVTGASGHLGGNLVHALVDRGRRVRVLIRNDTRAVDGLDVERFSGDIREAADVRAAMDGVEVVYHLAATISIQGGKGGLVAATNVVGTENVVEACLDAGVRRLVHFSSIDAIEHPPSGLPVTEETPLVGPRGGAAYDRSKAESERTVLAAVERGLDVVVLSPSAVIGRLDFKPSLQGRVLLDLFHRRLPALVQGGFDWVDVRDVIEGAIAAEERGQSGEKYILSGSWRSIAELARIASDITGVRPPRVTAPRWSAYLGLPFVWAWGKLTRREPLYTGQALRALGRGRDIRHDKAARELGYTVHPLEDTLADAYGWFREAGYLEGLSEAGAPS